MNNRYGPGMALAPLRRVPARLGCTIDTLEARECAGALDCAPDCSKDFLDTLPHRAIIECRGTNNTTQGESSHDEQDCRSRSTQGHPRDSPLPRGWPQVESQECTGAYCHPRPYPLPLAQRLRSLRSWLPIH